MVRDGVFEGIVVAEEGIERVMYMLVFCRSLDVLSMLVGLLDGGMEREDGWTSGEGENNCGGE